MACASNRLEYSGLIARWVVTTTIGRYSLWRKSISVIYLGQCWIIRADEFDCSNLRSDESMVSINYRATEAYFDSSLLPRIELFNPKADCIEVFS